MKRVLAFLAAPLIALAALVAAPLTAQAANPVATPSWGKANLISYADSDFEGGIGDWITAANSTVTQDTTTAYLHLDSLKAVAIAAGTQQYKLGPNAGQINVTAGDTYRVSGWFKGTAGRTITWALPFFTSTAGWLGWTSGTAATITTTGTWQYVSTTIAAPATAAYAYGGPRVTETGALAGEALNMDEVLVEPYRSATLIGAEDTSGDGTAFAGTNSTIGPLQSDKIFYSSSSALPASFTGSVCANLPAAVTCVISYKVQTTNVASFVASIPVGRNVFMEYWQEPENDTFANGGSCNTGTNGGNFVCQFEAQSNLIRASTTTANRANVFVADNAMDYQYFAGTGHNLGGAPTACSFTVPSAYVDAYFNDHYEATASGNNMSVDAGSQAGYNGWLGCVAPQNKPIGFAEYGLNYTTPTSANNLSTSQAFAADNTYLATESFTVGTKTYKLPVLLWEYWYDNNANGYFEFTPGGSPDGTQAVNTWVGDETANGGGANS